MAKGLSEWFEEEMMNRTFRKGDIMEKLQEVLEVFNKEFATGSAGYCYYKMFSDGSGAFYDDDYEQICELHANELKSLSVADIVQGAKLKRINDDRRNKGVYYWRPVAGNAYRIYHTWLDSIPYIGSMDEVEQVVSLLNKETT